MNVCLQLSRLGISAALCTTLGDDPLGRGLKKELAQAGVDVRRVSMTCHRTGLVLTAISEDGASSFMNYRQREDEAQSLAGALPEQWDGRIVHFTGIVPLAGALEAVEQGVETARRQGKAVMMDVNARPRLWSGIGDGFRMFQQADVVKCSHQDLEVLKTSAESLRKKMRSEAWLVVTDGANETQVLGPSVELKMQVRRVIAASAMGAGDVFCAGMLAELVSQKQETWANDDVMRRAIERGHEVAWTWVSGRTKQA